jgi:hypothetical protein
MIHVPESARVINHPFLASRRSDGNNGCFLIDSPEPGWRLAIIVSDGTDARVPEGLGWEHVSVHVFRKNGARQRTPTWREMVFVKGVFWDAEDVVMQLHPRRSEYVDNHQHTLHLWRHEAIPTPPPSLVGVLEAEP